MLGGGGRVFPAEALPALLCLPILCSLCSGIKLESLVTRDISNVCLHLGLAFLLITCRCRLSASSGWQWMQVHWS